MPDGDVKNAPTNCIGRTGKKSKRLTGTPEVSGKLTIGY